MKRTKNFCTKCGAGLAFRVPEKRCPKCKKNNKRMINNG